MLSYISYRFLPFLLVALFIESASVLGCAESTPTPSSSKPVDTEPKKVAFTEVTAKSGLGKFRHVTGAFGEKRMPEWMGSGGGFIDYDGDGWLDILLVGGGNWPNRSGKKVPALSLYHNNGDGTFTNRTEEAGLGNLSAYGFGITAADYDNDRDQDFFFTTLHENMLFRNDGGTFIEVGQEAGLAKQSVWSSSTLFFDADRDGWLDLYVGNYIEWSPEKDIWCSLDGESKAYCNPELYDGIPSRFYRNDGDGTFTDRTRAAGFLPAPGKTLGVAEFDFNQDGWPDLAVANDMQRDLLYKNDGNGTFTERGMLSGTAFDERGRARAGMGIDAGIVDSTRQVSLFVGNFSNEMIGVYRHLRNDLFIDRAAQSKIGHSSLLTLTFGLFIFDVDLDGDLDLFAANGHMQEDIEHVQDGITYQQSPQLFLNQGNGTFEELGRQTSDLLSRRMVARGAAYGDYDRDGDLDVLVTENGGPVHLWRNEVREGSEEGPHFLRVELQGRKSNRDGLGARVVVVKNNKYMERRIRTGSSYLSQSEKVVTFGLGEATSADSLLVYWPSGQIGRFEEVASNQEVRIVEGRKKLKVRFRSGQGNIAWQDDVSKADFSCPFC